MSGYGDFGGGLRDAGNGANDTGGNYGFVINAEPDKEITRQAQTAKESECMYPPVSVHDEKYQISYKGLHAFKDMRWSHASESEFRNNIDMVNYMDNVAGLFAKGEKPWQIIQHLSFPGTVKNDVLSIEGAGKDNTLGWSEKATVRHTGNRRMMSGQLYYLDLPPLGDEMYSGGASKMADMVPRALPLWTMPYDPAIHRGSPELIYRALTDEAMTNQNRTEYLLHKQARKWLSAVINTSLVTGAMLLTATLGEDTTAAFAQQVVELLRAPQQRTAFENELVRTLLDPTGRIGGTGGANLFYPDLQHLPKTKLLPNRYAITGTTFPANSQNYEEYFADRNAGFNLANLPQTLSFDEGNTPNEPWQMDFNRRHLMAAENMFYTTVEVNGFYTNRVRGMVITSVDPGKDFDKVPMRIGTAA